MARSHDAGPMKRAGLLETNSDLVALSAASAEIDARYGETLRPLLPRRLADLAPAFARAA
jgi:hypothetical protein